MSLGLRASLGFRVFQGFEGFEAFQCFEGFKGAVGFFWVSESVEGFLRGFDRV